MDWELVTLSGRAFAPRSGHQMVAHSVDFVYPVVAVAASGADGGDYGF